jgi:hypothetical protein
VLPYIQLEKNDSIFIREFNPKDNEMFIWHKDKKDRIVKVISSDSWSLQMDNCLPVILTEGFNYLIQKNTWHRIIAGKNILRIEITELKPGQLK